MDYALASDRPFDLQGYAKPMPGYVVVKPKPKKAAAFVPTEQQIKQAAQCLIGYLNSVEGHYIGRASDLPGLIKEIRPSIHARGRRFGASSEDVCVTLLAAFLLLQQQQQVRELTDDGNFGIALKHWSPNRTYRDKYVNNRNRGRRVA